MKILAEEIGANSNSFGQVDRLVDSPGRWVGKKQGSGLRELMLFLKTKGANAFLDNCYLER